jgi:hypothetical protein
MDSLNVDEAPCTREVSSPMRDSIATLYICPADLSVSKGFLSLCFLVWKARRTAFDSLEKNEVL